MTTACGYTTSSQDTQKTISLVEAPFWKYLEILRKEGYESDADASELLYVEMLTNVEGSDGKRYTREQVMNTSFQNLVKAMDVIMEQANEEIRTGIGTPSIHGPMLHGSGANDLTEDQLDYLTRRQLRIHEEEKLRLRL